jgi:serine/threonine-protein kinase RsbW
MRLNQMWRSSEMLKQEHLTVRTDITLLTEVLGWFEQFCQKNLSQLEWLADGSTSLTLALDMIKLALDEGFTNAVRHAHKDLPPETPIEIELTLYHHRLEIRIWDRGEPINPDTLAEFKPGTLQAGGVGRYLMKKISDELIDEHLPDGRNCLLMVKRKHV